MIKFDDKSLINLPNKIKISLRQIGPLTSMLSELTHFQLLVMNAKESIEIFAWSKEQNSVKVVPKVYPQLPTCPENPAFSPHTSCETLHEIIFHTNDTK